MVEGEDCLLILLLMVCLFLQVKGGEYFLEPLCNQTHCREAICVNGTCLHGCKDGYMEPSCLNSCSVGCTARKCEDVGTGIGQCTEGCIPGFWGVTCSSPCPGSCLSCSRERGEECDVCPEFYYGKTCEKDCRAACSTTGCNVNGSCKHGSAIACGNGKYGGKCLMGCSKGCEYGACNRTSGICLHGCKRGYFGERCESICNSYCKRQICNIKGLCTEGCETGYFGNDCDFRCESGCRWRLCDRQTGDCSNGCKNGYYGIKCNMTCLSGCAVCHGSTGECIESETSTVAKMGQSAPNWTVYYITGSVATGSILFCGIIVFLLTKRCVNNRRSDNGNLDSVRGQLYHEINDAEVDKYDDRGTQGQLPELLPNRQIEINVEDILFQSESNRISEDDTKYLHSKYLSPVVTRRDVHSV